ASDKPCKDSSISSIVQRLGRAAHNPQLKDHGILLILPSSNDTKFADPNLTQYIMTDGCRRKVFNEVFGNKNQPNGSYCDFCHPVHLQSQVSYKDIHIDVISQVRAPTRASEQEELAKEPIRNWRLMVHKRDYKPVWLFLRIGGRFNREVE
ncbi:hypothetical protein BGZ54_003878, partial [Gamsiella multidivaricata]